MSLLEPIEQLFDGRMVDRPALAVILQVLLADVSDIARLAVLGEQVVKRLLTRRPYVGGNGFVPFLAVGEDRVDVENHAAEVIHPMLDDIANGETRPHADGRIYQPTGLGREEVRSVHDADIGFVRFWNKQG